MSTRATYEIHPRATTFGDKPMTFYCHCDGYPAGAAHRFANMIAAHTRPASGDRKGLMGAADVRGCFPFAFIRGNDDAEPIDAHETVGNTEYRYIVTPDAEHGLTVQVGSRSYGAWGWAKPKPLHHFINENRAGWEDATPPIVAARLKPAPAPLLLFTLEAAEEIARLCWHRGEGFNEGNPNRETYLVVAHELHACAQIERANENSRRRAQALATMRSAQVA